MFTWCLFGHPSSNCIIGGKIQTLLLHNYLLVFLSSALLLFMSGELGRLHNAVHGLWNGYMSEWWNSEALCIVLPFYPFQTIVPSTVVYFDVEWGEVKPSALLKISSWNWTLCCCYVVIVAEIMAINKLKLLARERGIQENTLETSQDRGVLSAIFLTWAPIGIICLRAK